MKYVLVQTFMRLKTGQSPAQEQEVEVRIEVPGRDFDVSEYRERARDLLKDIPAAKFKSGWTDWMPRRQEILELECENEDDIGPMDAFDIDELPLDEDGEVDEDGEPVPEYLSHEDWVGAQEASLIEQGLMPAPGSKPDKPKKAQGGDYIGDAARRLEPWKRYKIKNVYNKPEFPHEAVDILQPDFEFEDWKDERVSQLWKRAPGYKK